MAASEKMKQGIKNLRYQVMLALYLPILLYSFSTFDLDEKTFVTTSVDPVLVAEETIVLGQPFEARTFLAATGESPVTISVEEESGLEAVGDTLLRMTTGELLAEDEDEKVINYSATLRYQTVAGSTMSRPLTGRFRVRRPEIVAQSEAAEALYRQTLNQIRIEVPGLEERQLLTAIGGGDPNQGRSLSISPGGDQVVVRAFLPQEETGENVYLGQKQFAVIDPPRPEVRVLGPRGEELTSGDEIPNRFLFTFEMVPDREYQRRYPSDAKYSIRQARVSVRKGRTASREVGTFPLEGGGKLTLVRQLNQLGLQRGDQILIELQGISRINHAGRAIPVELSETSTSFGFTLAG